MGAEEESLESLAIPEAFQKPEVLEALDNGYRIEVDAQGQLTLRPPPPHERF